jgi:hypothetical protein
VKLTPYWHGIMTDRGTVFWCENVNGEAVCRQEQSFWGMQYTERKDVAPRVLGTIVDGRFPGIYKGDNRILREGRG